MPITQKLGNNKIDENDLPIHLRKKNYGNNSNSPTSVISNVPDGTNDNDILIWNGETDKWESTVNLQTDWLQTDNTKPDFLKNKPVGTRNGDMQVWDTTLGAWKNVFIYGLNVQTLSANIVLDDTFPEYNIFSNSVARTVRLTGSVNRKFTIYSVGPAPLLIYKDGTLIDAISPTQFKTYIFDGTNWKIFDYVKYATEANFGGVQIATDTQFNTNINDNDGILLMATINQLNGRIPLLSANNIPVINSNGVISNSNLTLVSSGASRYLLLTADGTNGTVSEIKTSVTGAFIRSTVRQNQSAELVISSDDGYIEVISNNNPFRYKNINTGDYLFIVDSDGVIYCIGIRINSASKGAGKILTSDADGNGTWQTPVLATIEVAGGVEIATQTEFTAGTEKNGSKFLMATIPQIKEYVPPQKYASLGTDVLIDIDNWFYDIMTISIPSATFKYEIECILYVEYATDTTDMQFQIVRSNTSNLSECRGIITQIAQDGTVFPTNSKFWVGSTGAWAGADLLSANTMQRGLLDDTLQVVTLKAFIQPSAGLNLTIKATKNNGSQCKIKARSYFLAKGYN